MNREDFVVKVISPIAFTLVLFILWQAICKGFSVPMTILPAPSDIFAALWKYRAPIVDNGVESNPLEKLSCPSAPELAQAVFAQKEKRRRSLAALL